MFHSGGAPVPTQKEIEEYNAVVNNEIQRCVTRLNISDQEKIYLQLNVKQNLIYISRKYAVDKPTPTHLAQQPLIYRGIARWQLDALIKENKGPLELASALLDPERQAILASASLTVAHNIVVSTTKDAAGGNISSFAHMRLYQDYYGGLTGTRFP